MKRAHVLIVSVGGLAVLIGALLFMGVKRSARIEELATQAQADARYRKADVYFKGSEDDRKYVDALFTHAAGVAKQKLDAFFSLPPDPDSFYVILYQTMIAQANEQGKQDIAKSLRIWVLGQGYTDRRL